MTVRTYSSPEAFKQALEQRLRTSAKSGAGFARNRQLLVFDRFLARIVAVLGDAVTLKGGLVLELRLERARTTKDGDLRMTGAPDDVLAKLQEAGRLDLGDFMTFELGPDEEHPEIQNDGLQYDGLRFRAECKLAGCLNGERLWSTNGDHVPSIQETIFNVIDLETTGLDPVVDKIVEVASVRMTLAKGIIGTWSSLVNPEGHPMTAGASAENHIEDEDVADAPLLPSLMDRVTGGDFQAAAAHNASFDTGFLPLEVPVICTLRLAQRLWPDLEKHSNQFLRYHFKLPCHEVKALVAHRALADAIVTAHLLKFELEEVLRRAKEPGAVTVAKLVAWNNGPILLLTCRFGRHRGTPWAQVPKDYLRWMISPTGMTDMGSDQRYTVEVHLGLRERV